MGKWNCRISCKLYHRENGELIVYSRLDESVYEQVWDVNSTFERFYSNQQEYRVLILTMYSFSLLEKNDTGYFTLSETTKLDLFGEFLNNLPNEYEVVSTKQLQYYIDSGIIKTELVLSLDNLENECRDNLVIAMDFVNFNYYISFCLLQSYQCFSQK